MVKFWMEASLVLLVLQTKSINCNGGSDIQWAIVNSGKIPISKILFDISIIKQPTIPYSYSIIRLFHTKLYAPLSLTLLRRSNFVTHTTSPPIYSGWIKRYKFTHHYFDILIRLCCCCHCYSLEEFIDEEFSLCMKFISTIEYSEWLSMFPKKIVFIR